MIQIQALQKWWFLINHPIQFKSLHDQQLSINESIMIAIIIASLFLIISLIRDYHVYAKIKRDNRNHPEKIMHQYYDVKSKATRFKWFDDSDNIATTIGMLILYLVVGTIITWMLIICAVMIYLGVLNAFYHIFIAHFQFQTAFTTLAIIILIVTLIIGANHHRPQWLRLLLVLIALVSVISLALLWLF